MCPLPFHPLPLLPFLSLDFQLMHFNNQIRFHWISIVKEVEMKFSKAKALNSLVLLFKKYENFAYSLHSKQKAKEKSKLQQLKLFAPKMQFFNAFFSTQKKLLLCEINSQRFFTDTQITSFCENQPGGFVVHLIAARSLSHLPALTLSTCVNSF